MGTSALLTLLPNLTVPDSWRSSRETLGTKFILFKPMHLMIRHSVHHAQKLLCPSSHVRAPPPATMPLAASSPASAARQLQGSAGPRIRPPAVRESQDCQALYRRAAALGVHRPDLKLLGPGPPTLAPFPSPWVIGPPAPELRRVLRLLALQVTEQKSGSQPRPRPSRWASPWWRQHPLTEQGDPWGVAVSGAD